MTFISLSLMIGCPEHLGGTRVGRAWQEGCLVLYLELGFPYCRVRIRLLVLAMRR